MGQVAQLGIAKLILGVPLFALAAWLSWLGIRPFAELVNTELVNQENETGQ